MSDSQDNHAPGEQREGEVPAQPAEQPMDIHKPKPIRSLKELASEIGVIVLGILIALGLEQAIESWHERQQVKEAHAAINEELREGLASAHVIQASRDCRQQQFEALAVTLGKGDMDRVRSMLNESRIIPLTGIQDAAWKTALATGVANRFNQQERGYYNSLSFLSVSVLDLFQDYHRSEKRLTFLTQGSLGRSPAISSQALAQLADMVSDMNNIEGETSSYILLFEEGLGLKARQSNYDALLGGTDFVRQCQAAAAAMVNGAAAR